MASFDGVEFSERGAGNGAMFPIHPIRINTVILKIPGGAKSVLQTFGVPPSAFDMPARVDAAHLSALRGKVGTSGTLIYSFGSFTARLESVSEPAEVKRDRDYYFVTLKLHITQPFP